jgi:hypothetical protein
LGQNAKDKGSSLDRIQQNDANRAKKFSDNYAPCQGTSLYNSLLVGVVGRSDVNGEVAPCSAD